jgi:pimeloyl-ACP methyl ester carboxylesterase
VLRAGVVLLVVLLALLALAWLLQRRMIYFPDPDAPPAAASVLPGAREVTVRTEDGLDLGAWFVPPTGADRNLTVLVLPGNAGSRLLRAPLADRLAAEGFAVLLLDYRGYAGNAGSPSEDGLFADARAAVRQLAARGSPPQRTIYYGESLGAAVAVRLAVEHPPAALVLRSPFTDLAAVGSRHYPFLPVRLLLSDRFPVAGPVAHVRAPTAVVYGSRDATVPPELSAAVASAAAGLVRSVEVPGADHNDAALLAGDELIAAVVAVSGRAPP